MHNALTSSRYRLFCLVPERSEGRPRGRPRGAMKPSRASSYALHAVAFMAAQKDNAGPVASHHIAAARGIPDRFLLKVLKPLV